MDKSYNALKEELRHALDNIDKLSNKNSELFHEVEMYKAAYKDLVEDFGKESLEPHQQAYDATVKNLRARLQRKLDKRKANDKKEN